MGRDYALAMIESAYRRYGRHAPAERPYYAELFGPQRAFVEDPAKRKVALCSRRAGKTWGVAAWLLDGAEDAPGEMSVYIALSRNNARLILWRTLEEIERRYQLGLAFREMDGQLIVETRNKHRIWLAGCKDSSQVDKFRGPKYRRAAIDEAASYGEYLRELVDDVLDAALLDHDGELAMVGTPGLTPVGYFYAATTGDGGPSWTTHQWTVLDNAHIPHAGGWLERKREQNGWDTTHPTYRREWLGEWVRDDEARIYPYDAAKNAYSPHEVDTAQMYRVLSVDLGFEDPTAFVMSASKRGLPKLYYEWARRQSGLTVAHIAARIDQIRHESKPDHIVVDAGALGKTIVEDLRRTYGIPCQPAEKKAKLATIHELRGALLAGQVRINPHACQLLREEWALLPWSEDRTDHDPRFADDCSDAALYGFRAHRLSSQWEEEPPRPGSPAAIEAEDRAHEARARQEIRRRQRDRWGRRR